MRKKLMIMMMCVTVATTTVVTPICASAAGISIENVSEVETKANKIVKKQVKSKDSKKTKIKKLFKYAVKTYNYGNKKVDTNTKNWQKKAATQMYSSKSGSCYHYAAAYAYLVKAATNYPVRVAVGKTNGFFKNVWQDHAWVEVKINKKWYICDPNMDKYGASPKGKYSGKYCLKAKNSKTMKKTFKASKYVTIKF